MSDNVLLCKLKGMARTQGGFVMSTTIYDVTYEQLQEWLKRDDGHSGVFVPERLQCQTISVGDYVVVQNFAYFGVKYFCAPVLTEVFRIRDKALDYADKNNANMLDTLQSCAIELEVWRVVGSVESDSCEFDEDAYIAEITDEWNSYMCGYVDDDVEPEIELRDEFCVFGSIGNNEVVQACFEDVNTARIFAKRIVGYPCDTVEVDYYHSGSCSLIHCYHAVRGGWYDSGNNDAVTYLADTLPPCDDSPIFAAPCNAWQEV